MMITDVAVNKVDLRIKESLERVPCTNRTKSIIIKGLIDLAYNRGEGTNTVVRGVGLPERLRLLRITTNNGKS